MRLTRTTILAAVIALFGSSCSTSSKTSFTPIPQSTVEYLWRNPLPTPPFIGWLYTVTEPDSGYEQAICIGIRENIVWEQGDWGGDVHERIQRTTIVRIDGEIVPATFMVFGTAVSILATQVGNQPPEQIGSVGGTRLCVDATYLSTGVHLATIEFSSRSGIQYRHEWAFFRPGAD